MADETVQKLIAELNGKIEEIKPQLKHIKEIYSLLEGIKRHTDASFNLPDLNWLIANKGEVQENIGLVQDIRPGKFYRKKLTDAAEEYLEIASHTVPLDEIINGLKKGGASIENDEEVETALTRATRKFKKFKIEGQKPSFGLLSWYEKKRKWTRGTGLEVTLESKDSGKGKDELAE